MGTISPPERKLRTRVGQATKGTRRMPWRKEPKKDGVSSDNPRGGATALEPGGSEWGNPATARVVTPA